MGLESLANGRKVIWAGSEQLQIALTHGGGHIAALRFPGLPESGNPFWQPPWKSYEPEDVSEELVKKEYGGPPEGRLLASILGHSLALDLYGPPSSEEAKSGGVTHGGVGVLPWNWKKEDARTVLGECRDDFAQLHFSRRVQVRDSYALIEERIENLCDWDRPIGWQQHVSLGPPFTQQGFWAWSNCDLGATHPQDFGIGAQLVSGKETRWPYAPRRNGGACDYRAPLDDDITANDFSGFRVSPEQEYGAFVAGNTRLGFALGYIWPRKFFPWMGVWDEHHAREVRPWCKRASVRAYEFGVSPFPLARRQMLAMPYFLNQPAYLVLPGRATLWVRYILGVFTEVAEAADLALSPGSAALVKNGHKISTITLPETCESSPRTEMEA